MNIVYRVSLLVFLFVSLEACASVPSRPVEMPVSDERGFVTTLNKYGWMATVLDEISDEFVQYATENSHSYPALDIGTAYGHTPSLVIEGGGKIIANDMEPKHLEILLNKTPVSLRSRLELNTKRFPEDMVFPDQSLSAVLACRLFHFLDGSQLELAVKKIYRWLVPGGRVFVFANSPYRKSLGNFVENYDTNKIGARYPGIIRQLGEVNKDQANQLPPFFHYLDTEVLTRLFTEAGFKVEKAKYISLPGESSAIYFDGRENVGLIASKPL